MKNIVHYKAVVFAVVVLVALLITQYQSDGALEKSAASLIDENINAASIDSATVLVQANQQLDFSIPSPPPELNLQSALVKDLGTNFYFLKINTQQSWPLASLTKLLTAVVALENMEPTDEVIYLVKRMMIISDNGAAEELANLYGADKFIGLMQNKMVELGMSKTSIFDVIGLSFLNQSTISDIEKLVDYIVKNHPQIFQFSREREIVVNGRTLTNINEFVVQPNFMGGKTGYTNEANGNLVSIFQYMGRPLLIVVLGTPDKAERFNQTKILFEWISKFYN